MLPPGCETKYLGGRDTSQLFVTEGYHRHRQPQLLFAGCGKLHILVGYTIYAAPVEPFAISGWETVIWQITP